MIERGDGFTPLFDDVVQKAGTTGAIVFGVIQRHCEMRHGYCHASVETMAELTGLGRSTIRKHIRLLEQEEMIRCIMPFSIHTPPGYVCTYTPNVKRESAI